MTVPSLKFLVVLISVCCFTIPVADINGGPAKKITPVPLPTGLKSEELKQARLVISKYLKHANQFHSGIFRIKGIRHSYDNLYEWDNKADVKILCAFDYDNNCLRFDRDQGPVYPNEIEKKNSIKYRQSAWTSDYFLLNIPHGNRSSISLFKPERSRGWSRQLNPFDVRKLVFTGIHGMQHKNKELGKLSDFENRFKEKGPYSEKWMIEIVEEPKGLHRITWLINRSPRTNNSVSFSGIKNSVWFDKNSGYAPVKRELRVSKRSSRNAKNIKEVEWKHPMDSSSATWTKKDGYWVPETFQVEHFNLMDDDPDKVERSDSYSYNFTWESINKEVPAKYFMPDGLEEEIRKNNPKSEVWIIDYTTEGKPITLKSPLRK